MANKSFNQEIQDLENGLNQLIKLKENAKTFRDHEKIKHNMEIQRARIDFFKRGYNLCKRELSSQQKLKTQEEVKHYE